MNRTAFFAKVRVTLFAGSLSQSQVDGMQAILDEWDKRRLTTVGYLAYMLATGYWETARTLQPIAEYGKGRGHPYGLPGRNHGQAPYGRGLVQLTFDDNYERADRELALGGALVANYDLALRIDIAVKIMFGGMLAGWFTGKKLSDYITATSADFVNARRIINGTDHAVLIAGFAKSFETAIIAALVPQPMTSDQPVIPVTPPPVVVKPTPPVNQPPSQEVVQAVVPVGFWAHLWKWIFG